MFIIIQTTLGLHNKYGIDEQLYDSKEISRLIEIMAPYYWLKAPNNESILVTINNETQEFLYQDNLTQFLDTYIIDSINSHYIDHYYYAALQFINGVKHVLGINVTRNLIQGLTSLQAASRYGCNEATIILGNGHELGTYGLSKSPKLAYHYYMELYKSWITGVSQAHQYSHSSTKRLNQILASGTEQDHVIPTAERQHMIMSSIRGDNQRELHANIISLSALSGQFGFEQRDDMAAYFAYLSSVSDYNIQLNKTQNSIQYLLQQEQENFNKSLQNKQPSPISDNQNSSEQAATKQPIHPTKQSVIEKYTYDGVNLIQFDQTIPLSRDSFYDALQQLCKKILSTIYSSYDYFDTFVDLRKKLNLRSDQQPSSDELYKHMLNEKRSFAYYATKMFIDRTDKMPSLGFLRDKSYIVDQGPDVYVDDLLINFTRTREYEETCTRRGQSMAVLRYFILRNPELLPEHVIKSNNHRNIARILSLGASYYQCHMGLTGTAFDDIYGYRPDKHGEAVNAADQNQTNAIQNGINETNNNQNIKSEQKNASNNDLSSQMINVPELKAAIMALDIASQAGSFEASYYEALLLNNSLYDLGIQKAAEHLFLYHKQFSNIIFNRLKGQPKIIRILLSHAAHGQLLGGQFLQGLSEFNGFGGFIPQKAAGLAKMKKVAHRISFDWNIQKVQERIAQKGFKQDWNGVFCQLFIRGMAGDAISLSNAAKLAMNNRIAQHKQRKSISCIDVTINFQGKGRKSINVTDISGIQSLIIELYSVLHLYDADLLDMSRRLCSNDIQRCLFVVFGFEGQQLNKEQFQIIKQYLLEKNQWIILSLAERLGGEKLQYDFTKYKKGLRGKFDDFKALYEAVNRGEIKSTKQYIIDYLRKNKSKTSQIIYDCYFSTYEEQNKMLKRFPSCLTMNFIIDHLFGQKTDQIKYLQIQQNVLKQKLVSEQKINQQRFDDLMTQFLLEFPDKSAETMFFDINKLVCNETTIKPKQFWNANLDVKYTVQDISDIVIVQNKMQNRYKAKVDAKLNVKPYPFNNGTIVKYTTNKKVKQHVYVSEANHAYEYQIDCASKINPVTQNFVLRQLIKAYVNVACNKMLIFIGCGLAVVLMLRDYFNSKKLNNLRVQAEEAELGIYDDTSPEDESED